MKGKSGKLQMMRLNRANAILLMCAATAFAQERMANTLRDGILEEESKLNPAAAIQQYQKVLMQYAEARQTAAAALFRLGECYRKQANRGPAVEAYTRVAKEFGDQDPFAAQSRTMLATSYQIDLTASAQPRPNVKLTEAQRQYETRLTEARERYRASLEQQIQATQKQLDSIGQKRPGGSPVATAELQFQLNQLRHTLAILDAQNGRGSRSGRGSR